MTSESYEITLSRSLINQFDDACFRLEIDIYRPTLEAAFERDVLQSNDAKTLYQVIIDYPLVLEDPLFNKPNLLSFCKIFGNLPRKYARYFLNKLRGSTLDRRLYYSLEKMVSDSVDIE